MVLAPIGGFVFVLFSLATLAQIRRDKEWVTTAVLAALGFAAMLWFGIPVLT